MELGRAAERFTDLDLDHAAMKPDNKKRRSKKRRPAGYYGGRELKRIVKAKKLKRNVKKTGKWVGKYMKEHPEHKHLKTVIILGVMMKRYGFLFRRMIAELYFRRGSRKAAGLKDVPPKSWPRKRLKREPVDLLDGLIPFAAGKAAYGPFSADSTHHRFNRYVLADHPKGKRWVADTCKHHALISLDGKVLASMVTDGDGADTTMFGKLCAKIPQGSGAALGDGAYCSSTNCEAAVAKGRDQYFEPKKNNTGKGTDAWAKMVKLWKEHPGRFYEVYKARATIEAAFSAIKGRFVYCVRSVTIHMQERELAIVSICRNIGA